MILFYFLTILGCIFMLCILIFLLSLCIVTKSEGISYELEELLESRYNDDYMEEPVDIEMIESTSYLDKFMGYLKNFISLFSQNDCESYYFHKDYVYGYTPQFVIENFTHELPEKTEYSTGYRPQVLTSVLKHHLYSSEQEYNKLIDRLSVSEFERDKRDNLVWEALIMCKKALQGETYESPIIGHNSPIVARSNSSILEYENRFRINSSLTNSPVRNSSISSSPSVTHQALINDITTLLNSPDFNNSPSISGDNPIFRNNSPNISRDSPRIDTAPFSRNSLFTRVNTPVSVNSSIRGNTPILSNTPVLGNTPIMDNTADLSNASVLGNSTRVGSNTLLKSNIITTDNFTTGSVNPLGLSTSFVENQSTSSSNSLIGHKRYDSLIESNSRIESTNSLMDSQNTLLDTKHYSNIIKPPLRDVYSPNTLRRFGHVWANNTSIWDYKPMKRYGVAQWNSPELD